MKKIKLFLTAITLVAGTWLAKAQSCSSTSCNVSTCEYVCNGGFEYYSTLPTGISQIGNACGWINQNGSTTPDYYNSGCTGSASLVSVPCNTSGKEPVRTPGSTAYAGFAVRDINSWNERIASKLTTTLNVNSTYEVSFWLSLAEETGYNELNTIGFSLGQWNGSIVTLPNTINIINTSSVTNDGWTKITYTVNVGQMSAPPDYIVIGGFRDVMGASNSFTPVTGGASTITCTGFSYPSPSPTESYYFIDDVSIKEIIPITATASHTTGCVGEVFTLTVTGVDTYTWNPGNIVGSTTTVNPSSSTIYTVTGTSTAGCLASPETITISPYTCCLNPNSGKINFRDVNLMPYSTSTAIAIPWSALASGTVVYTGNVAIPSNSIITSTLSVIGSMSVSATLTFNTSNISFGEAAAMKQYSNTTIDHSYLWGCDKLWAGVQSYAQLLVTNSWFEDAYKAIDEGYYFTPVSNHPGITVDNVMFNKNYHGITTGSSTMTPGNFRIKGCLFSSRSFGTPNYTTTTRYNSLFPNPSAKPPAKIKGSTVYSITANTIRSDVGIILVGLTSTTTPNYFDIGAVDCSSGTNATYTNRFDYINEGIVTGSARVSIINNIFSNIINTGVGNTLGAIYHLNAFGGTETRVGALGGGCYPTSHYKNVFSLVKDGVNAVYGGQLDVQYNDFDNVSRYGVAVTSWSAGVNAATQTVVVSNNSFSTTSYAFYASDNRTITATVASNTLVQSQPTYTSTGYGAYINEIAKPATTSYSIHSNNFSGGQYSVYSVNTQNVRVVNNTIQVKKPTTTSIFNGGVWLDNSDNCFVKGNIISCNPTNSGSWNTFGVFANASYNNTVKCNSITAVSSCMKFQGACEPTTIYTNTLNNVPGDPCLYGIWFDQGGQTGHIGYNNGSQWQMSDDVWGDFLYASGGADTKCQTSSNTSGTCTIHYDITGAGKTAASHQPSVNINTFGGTDFSQSYSTTVNGNTNSQGCGEPSRFMNVPLNGAGKNTGGDLTLGNESQNPSFTLQQENNEAANFYNHPYKKRIIMKTYDSNGKQIVTNEDAFWTVDSLMTSYTQSGNSATINSAKTINAAITAVNNIEQNQKDFNSIYCVYLEDDSLVTANQLQDIKDLAALCPFTEGLAVYNARALVRKWDDSTLYYNVCENNVPDLANDAARFAEKMNANAIVLPTVYPNPTTGNLMVNSGCKNCIFEVYDVIGKKVMSQKLNENETKVDLNSLNNGTYLYKVVQEGVILKADKLLLNR